MRIGRNQLLKQYGIDLPAGKYRIKLNDNIYTINTLKDDTEGCPLIGYNKKEDMIYNSKLAFRSFMPILRDALKKEKVWLTISNWFLYKKKG